MSNLTPIFKLKWIFFFCIDILGKPSICNMQCLWCICMHTHTHS